MMKVTQKELRDLVRMKEAIDITYADNKDYDSLMKEESRLDQIAYSHGTYGLNGALLKGYNTGNLYAITSRSNAIYIFC